MIQKACVSYWKNIKATKDCYSLAFCVNNHRNKAGIHFKNAFNLFSCCKARSSISTAYFLTDVSRSELDKPPKCLLHSLPRWFFFLVIITSMFSSCLVLTSLTAFQTHYVDMEDKFPAISQQPFRYFMTDISSLRPTLSLFLIHINSFLDLLSLLLFSHRNSHIFAYVQHPKQGTLFPSDIVHRRKGLLSAFHELCFSLSILGWYLPFLQKIIVHFWPCSACNSFWYSSSFIAL